MLKTGDWCLIVQNRYGSEMVSVQVTACDVSCRQFFTFLRREKSWTGMKMRLSILNAVQRQCQNQKPHTYGFQ